MSILMGEKGPKRDIVLMNASAALVIAGKAEGLRDAMLLAADAIDSGSSLRKLNDIIKVSNNI